MRSTVYWSTHEASLCFSLNIANKQEGLSMVEKEKLGGSRPPSSQPGRRRHSRVQLTLNSTHLLVFLL
ncbi:unnamed protein product [Cuscuta campestris]|uniref:Uncharacterized protein n=1 Tax=Cuscuta campestris TaxID=132261 RepID=A0A484NQ23_9ASTE|nr:unnamed protein product [Cuscuta campestris]